MTYDGLFSDILLPDQIKNLSVCFLIKDKQTHFGGCAGNIAYNLRLLEENPILIGVVGNDFDKYAKKLQKLNIDTHEIIEFKDKETASAIILSDKNGNQITLFYPGASSENPDIHLENYKNTDALALIGPDNIQRMLQLVSECQRLKIPYIFDPGQQLPVFNRENLINAISLAKGILVNEYELHLFKQKTALSSKDMVQTAEFLIVTLGEKGSKIETKHEIIEIPAVIPSLICDPTGCGDGYRAGILKGLKEGYNWEKTGRIASLLATYAIENKGTQNHHFTLTQFKTRYQKEFGTPYN